jgi:tetratricopeptide (TPR) repeat protein
VAIPRPDEAVPPGPARDFVDALHDLYDDAGRPSARVISSAIQRNATLTREPVSHETVSSALRGMSVPSWAKVQSIVVVLAGMSVHRPDIDQVVQHIHALWVIVRPSRPPAQRGRPDPIPVVEPSIPEPQDSVPVRARPALSAGPVVGDVPDRNPYFTGRELLLDSVHEHLAANPNSLLVLYGLSGVGKTQLAREYLERYGEPYAVRWWVRADRPADARGSLAALAHQLGIPRQHSTEQTVTVLLALLESRQFTYMLVLDGVGSADSSEADDVRRMIPTIGGHVIITTRDPGWANETTSFEVPNLTPAEAIEFLRARDHQMSDSEARDVVRSLGGFPLALEQIAALQSATARPWTELIARIAEPGLLAAGQPSHYPHTVAASMQLALRQLADANPHALAVFELFAWFGAAPVSTVLLRSGRSADLPSVLQRPLQDPYLLGKAIQDMSRFGLVRLQSQAERVEVQPLTRQVLRDLLSPADLERAQRCGQAILAAGDPGWPDELGSWELHREMAAHVLPTGLIGSRSEQAQRAVLNQMRYRYLTGDHEEARRLAEAAVVAWREPDVLGPDHELVLLATREWANALRAKGRYDEARQLTADAMIRLRAAMGDDHVHTLAMATSHAADLRIAGQYQEALHLVEATYRRHVERFGDGDARTGRSHHNVAVSLRLVGNFRRAHAIDQDRYQSQRESAGDLHRTTLLTANALGEDLYGLGRYREALNLLVPVEGAWRTAHGRHSGALLVRRTLALARAGLGEVAPALEALSELHRNCIDAFGADHEYTVATTMSLANLLRQWGEPDRAFVHAMDAVNTYRQTLGGRNPFTLAAEVNLAAVLRGKGEPMRARPTDEAARSGLREVVGEEHPFTIAATVGLAGDLAMVGDHPGALSLSSRAYETAQAVRGATHPDTLAAAANLALDRRATGDHAAADVLTRDTLAALRRSLGPNHPMVTAVAGGRRLDVCIEPPST